MRIEPRATSIPLTIGRVAREVPGTILEWGRELWRFRHLIGALAWRDIRVRYRQTVLGVAWAMLLPLSMMLVFVFVFTRAIRTPSALLDTGIPYALFAYCGLAPWTFFASSLNGCVQSLTANRNLITKLYFPREAFPLACVLSSLIDLVIAMGVLAVLIGWYQVSQQWHWSPHVPLLFVPMVVLVHAALTAGLGMLLAMANLFQRDVRQGTGVVLQLWMFVSAVIVPAPSDGSWTARLIEWNPPTPIIQAYRDCILLGRMPEAGGFLYAVVTATLTLALGWIGFRCRAHRFAECI